MAPGPPVSCSFWFEQDSPLESAGCDLRPTPHRTGGKPQLLPRARRTRLRPRVSQMVGDRSTDGEHVKVGDGGRGHAHHDPPALALELDPAPPPQLTVEADVARHGRELAALYARAAALPPGGPDDDVAAQGRGAEILARAAQQDIAAHR